LNNKSCRFKSSHGSCSAGRQNESLRAGIAENKHFRYRFSLAGRESCFFRPGENQVCLIKIILAK